MSFLVQPSPQTIPGGFLSLAALDYSVDQSAIVEKLNLLGGSASAVGGVEKLAFDSGGPCLVYNLYYIQPGNDNQAVRIRVTNNDATNIFDLSGNTLNAFNRGGPFIKSNPPFGLRFERLKIYVTTTFTDVNAIQNFYGYLVRLSS
jgi:hypothetical protein